MQLVLPAILPGNTIPYIVVLTFSSYGMLYVTLKAILVANDKNIDDEKMQLAD